LTDELCKSIFQQADQLCEAVRDTDIPVDLLQVSTILFHGYSSQFNPLGYMNLFSNQWELEMDFVDWSGFVLSKLIEARNRNTSLDTRNFGVDEKLLAQTIFGDEFISRTDFRETAQFRGLQNAIRELENNLLIEKYHSLRWWKATNVGRKLAKDITPLWQNICQEELEADQEQLLCLINQLSPSHGEDHVCLASISHETLLSHLQWPEGIQRLSFVAQDLEQLRLIGCREYFGSLTAWATYRGLVWETRRGLTFESMFIDDLVKDWETTSVEFKSDVSTETAGQIAEFIRDVLSLATTKASGLRWMIIGFDDDTHDYIGSPNPKLTQNHIEQLLQEYTKPMVQVQYQIVDHRKGPVGKLEMFRDATHLPYKVAKSLGSQRDTRRIREGDIYVRHGSQVQPPTPEELQALQEEGDQARLNR